MIIQKMKVSFSISKEGKEVASREIGDLKDVDKLLASLQEVLVQTSTAMSTEVDKQMGSKSQAKVKKNEKKKDSDSSESSEADDD